MLNADGAQDMTPIIVCLNDGNKSKPPGSVYYFWE
jgi:hypothetical protein